MLPFTQREGRTAASLSYFRARLVIFMCHHPCASLSVRLVLPSVSSVCLPFSYFLIAFPLLTPWSDLLSQVLPLPSCLLGLFQPHFFTRPTIFCHSLHFLIVPPPSDYSSALLVPLHPITSASRDHFTWFVFSLSCRLSILLPYGRLSLWLCFYLTFNIFVSHWCFKG